MNVYDIVLTTLVPFTFSWTSSSEDGPKLPFWSFFLSRASPGYRQLSYDVTGMVDLVEEQLIDICPKPGSLLAKLS